MKSNKKTYLAFTIDVDPDVNVPTEGQIGAVSNPPEAGTIRFESCENGLILLTELLQDLQIEATFFFEARTAVILHKKLNLNELMRNHEVGCHSLNHEDFMATAPDLKLDRARKIGLITQSLAKLKAIFPEHDIIGFRAPYCKIDLKLARILEELAFIYDSSVSITWGHGPRNGSLKFKPRYIAATGNKILELPLPLWRDEQSAILSSYLWPFLESDREIDEYKVHINSSIQIANDELIILGAHPWHIVETYKTGKLSENEIASNLGQITSFLNELKSIEDTQFIRLDKYIQKVSIGPTPISLEE